MFTISSNSITSTGVKIPNAATIIKAYFDAIAKEISSKIVCASAGNIEIDIVFDTTMTSTVASGAGNSISTVDPDRPGIFNFKQVPMQEINAGIDANGTLYDGRITIGSQLMQLMATEYERAAVAANSEAALMGSGTYSTLMHEMLHVIGVMGNDDPFTGAGKKADGTSAYIYDNWSTIIDGKPYFTGPTATAIYGTAVPLIRLGYPGVSMYHVDSWPQADGSVIGVLFNDLMQPNGNGDNPPRISNLDLAVLADLGYTIRDTLTSVDGHTFVPGQGAQPITGTSAINDKVAYVTAQASFTIEKSDALTTVASKLNTANVATLSGIESLSFADGTVSLDYNDVVQSLYIAYFGRPADKGGLANFQNALRAMGAPKDLAKLEATYGASAGLKELVDSFAASAESKAMYGAGSTAAFVKQVYVNVLGREPDAGGLAYWAGEIDNDHLGRPKAALSIMAGAQGNTTAQGLLDGKLVSNRVNAGSNFTLAIDTPVELKAYSGDAAAATARAMLATVQSATDTHLFQATVTATLDTLVARAASSIAAVEAPAVAGSDIELVGQPHVHHTGLLA